MEKQETQWHAHSYEAAFRDLHSSKEGLSNEEALIRLKKFGLNHLTAQSSENILWIIFRQLNNPLIYILLASTALAALLGNITHSTDFHCVIIINSLIG